MQTVVRIKKTQTQGRAGRGLQFKPLPMQTVDTNNKPNHSFY